MLGDMVLKLKLNLTFLHLIKFTTSQNILQNRTFSFNIFFLIWHLGLNYFGRTFASRSWLIHLNSISKDIPLKNSFSALCCPLNHPYSSAYLSKTITLKIAATLKIGHPLIYSIKKLMTVRMGFLVKWPQNIQMLVNSLALLWSMSLP